MDKRRTARVGEAIRDELSQLLSFEMEDPRLKGVSIAEVTVTPDGRQARVNAALYGSDAERKDALNALHHAASHLRRELAHRLQLRHVPELLFFADTGVEASSRVEVLLERVRKNNRARE